MKKKEEMFINPKLDALIRRIQEKGIITEDDVKKVL